MYICNSGVTQYDPYHCVAKLLPDDKLSANQGWEGRQPVFDLETFQFEVTRELRRDSEFPVVKTRIVGVSSVLKIFLKKGGLEDKLKREVNWKPRDRI